MLRVATTGQKDSHHDGFRYECRCDKLCDSLTTNCLEKMK